jgi:hypothetical protein
VLGLLEIDVFTAIIREADPGGLGACPQEVSLSRKEEIVVVV